MKKLLFLAAALSAACAASAQGYYTDAYNPDITRHTGRIAAQRAEFILPEVNGYNVYKADLHTHSVYSDGDCTPEFRVREAWYDGLDVLAITEHVEYRRHEGKMLNFLKGYVPEGTDPAKAPAGFGRFDSFNDPQLWEAARTWIAKLEAAQQSEATQG